MSIHQSSGERVRVARRMLGLTRKEMEDNFDISVNTLQAWETNKILLTPKGAKRLNEVFVNLGLVCSESWLLTGNGKAPIFLQDPTGSPNIIDEDFCILREIETFKAINPDPVIAIVADNAMEPLYEIGDFVGGNKKKLEQIIDIIGENCIIETVQGDTLVRRVMLGNKKFLYNLVCLNVNTDQQPIIPNVQIKFAAKIVLHRRKEN